MSHFTKTSKVKIVDKAAFVAACKELGFTDVRENCTIKDFGGATMKVDLAIKCGTYEVGLVKNADGKYDLVSDWWGIRTNGNSLPAAFRKAVGNTMSDQDIQDCLTRYTTKHTIQAKYKKLGFRCMVQEDDEKNLNMTLTRSY